MLEVVVSDSDPESNADDPSPEDLPSGVAVGGRSTSDADVSAVRGLFWRKDRDAERVPTPALNTVHKDGVASKVCTTKINYKLKPSIPDDIATGNNRPRRSRRFPISRSSAPEEAAKLVGDQTGYRSESEQRDLQVKDRRDRPPKPKKGLREILENKGPKYYTKSAEELFRSHPRFKKGLDAERERVKAGTSSTLDGAKQWNSRHAATGNETTRGLNRPRSPSQSSTSMQPLPKKIRKPDLPEINPTASDDKDLYEGTNLDPSLPRRRANTKGNPQPQNQASVAVPVRPAMPVQPSATRGQNPYYDVHNRENVEASDYPQDEPRRRIRNRGNRGNDGDKNHLAY